MRRAASRTFPALLALACLACTPPPLPSAPEGGARVAIRVTPASQRVTVDDPTPTVSAIWDRALQEALVRASPGPTISARAFAMVHTALYDTWASYDPVATGAIVGDTLQRTPEENTEANKAEAMSYAAYNLLSGMFPEDQEEFDRVMDALGYDTDPTELRGKPAGLAAVVLSRLLAERLDDGSNWDDDFEDPTGYVPVNASPMEIVDITRWTPENTPIDPESRVPDQEYYTPHWGNVTGFAISRGDALRPPPPEPFFVDGLPARLDYAARTVTVAGQTVPAGPELVGTVINPRFIAQAEEVVAKSAALTDRQKLVAEFWEDATDTAFPPGTWMVFAQYVSARDDHGLDDDAKLFFLVANAMLDASIVTWEAKTHYDYVRPVRAIRNLGELGLIGTPGTDEVTGETGHVISAWAGPGLGTKRILAQRFLSYQTPDLDPSPPFAEYPSGHSSFSGAGAEVLRAFTGSDRFGAAVTFEPGSSRFEPGVTPKAPVTLSWPTFTAAAAEAGLSRRYGGIHFEDGDLRAREMGREAGRRVLARARALFEGRSGI